MIILDIGISKKVWLDIIVFFVTAFAMKLEEILFTECVGKFEFKNPN